MLLDLRFRADSIPISHPKFSITYRGHNPKHNPLDPWYREPHNFLVCVPHVLRHCIAIDIHRGTDVGVPNEFLLYTDRGAH